MIDWTVWNFDRLMEQNKCLAHQPEKKKSEVTIFSEFENGTLLIER